MAGSSSSRAAEVLDDLVRDDPVRDRQRRSLFRRPEFRSDRDEGSVAERSAAPARRWDEWIRPAEPSRPNRSTLRVVVVAAVLLALVAGVAGRQYLARPAALDARLPIASEEAADTGPAATSSTSTGPSEGAGGTADATTGATATSSTSGPVFVHVAGAVASPGVVELPGGSRVVDAVRAAGGLRPDADSDRVNLAAPLVDGSRVVVPALGQAPPLEVVTVPPVSGSGGSAVGGSGGASASGASGAAGTFGPIDLNTATLEQLDELPGVGPSTAQAILDHRGSEGPFTSVDSLLDVRGIGDAKLGAIRDLVTVG